MTDEMTDAEVLRRAIKEIKYLRAKVDILDKHRRYWKHMYFKTSNAGTSVPYVEASGRAENAILPGDPKPVPSVYPSADVATHSAFNVADGQWVDHKGYRSQCGQCSHSTDRCGQIGYGEAL